MQYPYPQKLGKQRPIQIFRRDYNTGSKARPTSNEAASLSLQNPSYINNWLGNIGIAYQAKKSISEYKAAKIGGGSPTFKTIAEKLSKAAEKTKKFLTYADKIIGAIGGKQSEYQSGEMNVNGAKTTTTNYPASNNIDQSVKTDIPASTQPKGLFNLSYSNPAVAGDQQQGISFNQLWPIFLIGALIIMVKNEK